MKKKKILAIGCGGAGMFSLVVASQLKKDKFETIALSDEQDIYCRCTSSYVLAGKAEVDDAIQPESMVADYGVNIIHEKAVAIDTQRREVTTDKGTIFPYDYLVIATGARPSKPQIPGIDGAHVYTVRTSDDVRHIQSTARTAERVLVMGAGVIGMEMAAALKEKGTSGVTLIERAPSLSPEIAEKEFADRLVDLLKEKGVDVRFGHSVTEIKDTDDGKKQVSIKTETDTISLTVDMVVVATGVTPNIEIVSGTNIATTRLGITVNNRMETSVKGIYACGDCAAPTSAVTGERTQSTLASLAIQQSKIVGFQIAGYPIRYAGMTGAFAFGLFEKEYAAVGLTEEGARKRFRWVAVGHAESTDIYNDLKEKKPLSVKLIFAGPKMRLVGYEAFGNGVIASAEVASLAIGLHLSILKVLRFNYIAHPSMTAWPFMNPIIMASEDAMGNILKQVKAFFGRV